MNDNTKAYCDEHGAHCVQIERLERDILTQKAEIRDARKSLTHDLQRRDNDFKKVFITKHEFEPIKKLIYGVVAIILAEVVRRILS